MKKSEKTDNEKLWKEFDRYARYDDLKELYGKVLPPMK